MPVLGRQIVEICNREVWIVSGYDHYAEAKSIAGALGSHNQEERADAICDAIDSGVSGTEIFMQVRSYLRPVADDETLPPALRQRIHELLSRIDRTLAD
jgi:hypothetical protein